MRTVVLASTLLLALPAAAAFGAPPVVTLYAPADGTLVSGPVDIGASVAAGEAIDRVAFRVRGVLKFVDSTAPYGGPFPTGTVDDGPAVVTATAFAAGGGSGSAVVRLVLDNTKPALRVDGPDRETFAVGSTQHWTFAAQDASGIASLHCSVVAFGATPSFGPCPATGDFALTGQPVGTWTFSVRATDAAGNFTQSGRDVRIDPALTEPALPGPDLTAAPVGAAAALAAIPPAAAKPAPRLVAALSFGFTSTRRATTLRRLAVAGVPEGGTVRVQCPSGCARTSYVTTLPRGGRLRLQPVVKRRLKAGTTLAVTVSAPGFTAAVKVLTIRARKAPLVSTLCQPEGAQEPGPC